MKIKAIETWYAGCRFRSRLEARWAVFFDRLGIRWEYEPQGFLVGDEPNRRPYLPDFWLPAERLWVEVKGVEGRLDLQLLADAANPHCGLPGAPHEGRLLLLGPMPRFAPMFPGDDGMEPVAHSMLAFDKGDIVRDVACFDRGTLIRLHQEEIVGSDAGGPLRATGNYLNPPALFGSWNTPDDLEMIFRGYIAAKSARFEHGERGA